MPDVDYSYTKSPVALDKLADEIRASSIVTALRHCTLNGTNALVVTMAATLSQGDETTLGTLVTNHDGVPYSDPPLLVSVDEPKDSDGAVLSRIKQTATGWTFQDHSFHFKCSTPFLYSKKFNGDNIGFATVEFYELVNNVETKITGENATNQTYLTAHCIRTDVEWEPTHDIDVMAGELRFASEITDDVYLTVVAVPDIPAIYGGTKELLTGGKNLKFIAPKTPISIDGRVVKHLTYSPTYHTNKFEIVLRHPVGFSHEMQMSIQIYKA